MPHSSFGNLVKNHPMYGFVPQRFVLSEQFDEMPGNRFTLAIRVSRQVQRICFLQRFCDGFYVFLVPLDHLVFHGEAVFGINGPDFGDEVTYVPVRGHDLKVFAKILADRLGLCGRFDNYEVFRHEFPKLRN